MSFNSLYNAWYKEKEGDSNESVCNESACTLLALFHMIAAIALIITIGTTSFWLLFPALLYSFIDAYRYGKHTVSSNNKWAIPVGTLFHLAALFSSWIQDAIASPFRSIRYIYKSIRNPESQPFDAIIKKESAYFNTLGTLFTGIIIATICLCFFNPYTALGTLALVSAVMTTIAVGILISKAFEFFGRLSGVIRTRDLAKTITIPLRNSLEELKQEDDKKLLENKAEENKSKSFSSEGLNNITVQFCDGLTSERAILNYIKEEMSKNPSYQPPQYIFIKTETDEKNVGEGKDFKYIPYFIESIDKDYRVIKARNYEEFDKGRKNLITVLENKEKEATEVDCNQYAKLDKDQRQSINERVTKIRQIMSVQKKNDIIISLNDYDADFLLLDTSLKQPTQAPLIESNDAVKYKQISEKVVDISGVETLSTSKILKNTFYEMFKPRKMEGKHPYSFVSDSMSALKLEPKNDKSLETEAGRKVFDSVMSRALLPYRKRLQMAYVKEITSIPAGPNKIIASYLDDPVVDDTIEDNFLCNIYLQK